jgi:hypothetical protein
MSVWSDAVVGRLSYEMQRNLDFPTAVPLALEPTNRLVLSNKSTRSMISALVYGMASTLNGESLMVKHFLLGSTMLGGAFALSLSASAVTIGAGVANFEPTVSTSTSADSTLLVQVKGKGRGGASSSDDDDDQGDDNDDQGDDNDNQ